MNKQREAPAGKGFFFGQPEIIFGVDVRADSADPNASLQLAGVPLAADDEATKPVDCTSVPQSAI